MPENIVLTKRPVNENLAKYKIKKYVEFLKIKFSEIFRSKNILLFYQLTVSKNVSLK